MDEPIYFETPARLRAWFKKHHAKVPELLLGYWKVGSGQPSVTWPESVDEALCVGWIDGVRKRIDEQRYTIRFTPRRPGSVWSQVNVKRVGELVAEGRMQLQGWPSSKRAARVTSAATPSPTAHRTFRPSSQRTSRPPTRRPGISSSGNHPATAGPASTG
jgi:uncharacterized protein YdeI (YjbR/CyaY-like superfamily)